jgi:glutathione S-transferase
MAVSEQVCELREVVLRDKPQALLDVSPKGTVPVLVDVDGVVIDQSLDIMLWALRRNDPAGWLTPEWGNLAAMLSLIAQCDGDFKFHLDRYKYPQRFANEKGNESGAEHRARAQEWLMDINAKLEEAEFLFGLRVALADMAIVPFVRQFAHVDPDWFSAQPWPRLRAWLQAWQASPLFERIMQKVPPWQAGSAGARFPP